MFLPLSAVLATAFPAAVFAAGTPKFGYDPNTPISPISWPGLDLGEGVDNQCGGSKQSGIDIPRGSCDYTEANYIFAAGSCALDDIRFEINSHSIVAHYKEDSDCTKPRMMIPDVTGIKKPFDALQFHIHTGTDHAIDGTYYGADMHLVHKEVGGDRLAVLGFFLEPTSPSGVGKFSDLLTEWEAVAAETLTTCANKAVDTGDATDIIAALMSGGGRRILEEAAAKKEEQKNRKLPRSFNPYGLIPGGSSMYFYDGSLTTPPCTEIVWWNVIDKPVSLSIREFLRLTNLILDYMDPTTCKTGTVAAPSGFTGRPVQKINDRKITHLCPSGFQDPYIEFAERQNGNDNERYFRLDTSSASVASVVIGVFSTLTATAALFM